MQTVVQCSEVGETKAEPAAGDKTKLMNNILTRMRNFYWVRPYDKAAHRG